MERSTCSSAARWIPFLLLLLLAGVHPSRSSAIDPENIAPAEESDTQGGLDAVLRSYVTDPLSIPAFNVSSVTGFSDIQGWFWDLRLRGLGSVHVESVRVNLARMNATTLVFLPALRLEGQYSLQGMVAGIFPISGGGPFWMNVSDITVHLRGELDPSRFSRVFLDADQRAVRVYFANLGGDLSLISNAALNQLSEAIFARVKPHLLATVRSDLERALDNQLARLPQGLRSNDSVELFDAALEQAAIRMINDSLDPLPLRDHTETFSQQMLFLSLHGEAYIKDGQLRGLSTLRRTGPVEITYRNGQSVVLEANLGFSNLSGGYEWRAHLMGVGPSGQASVSVQAISAFLQVEQGLEPGARPHIAALRIERIRQIWVDVNGLGTWDFVLEIIVNLVTNSVKMSLAQTVSEPVRAAVQRELDNVSLGLV